MDYYYGTNVRELLIAIRQTRSLRRPGRACAAVIIGGWLPQVEFLEEVVALVVDDDEGREILDLDAPDRFHAEFGIFHHLDLLDAMLGEVRRGTADRTEIEAAVLLAGLAHRNRAIALGDHHHRSARRLELVDEGVHAPCGGRAERAGGVAVGRLGG